MAPRTTPVVYVLSQDTEINERIRIQSELTALFASDPESFISISHGPCAVVITWAPTHFNPAFLTKPH